MRRAGVLLFAVLFLSPCAHAEEPSPVRAMMEESGLVEQFGLIAQMYRARLLHDARMQGLTPEIGEALADVAVRAMDSPRFLNDLETELTATLAVDDVAVIREFYGSPLGRKVKRAEARASTVRQRAEIEAHRVELRFELNESPKRKEQFDRIDRNRRMSELSTAVTASLIYSVAVGGMATEGEGASTDALAALDIGVSAIRETLLPLARDDMSAVLVYTYRPLSNKDLEVYVAFLEAEQTSTVNAAILAAANGILQARQREIAEDFLTSVVRSKN